MTTTEPHLWDIDHPYYCNEGNFYERGLHNHFASWDEFTETLFFSGDRDQNLLFRWDWRKPGFHDWEGEEYLLLFFVIQRKGFNCSCQIPVTEADEPRVRWFLEECAKTMAAIWAPLELAELPKAVRRG